MPNDQAAQVSRRMTRDEILDLARDAVSHRPGQYGSPRDVFARIARAWEWYLAERMGHTVPIEPHDVAAMMRLLKECRLIENPAHQDSIADIAGYAACHGEVVGRKEPTE